LNLATAGNGDAGDVVAVLVTPNDGTASGTSAPASATVAADTTAPAAPSTPSSTTSTRSIALDWSDNTETDLAGYRVYRAAASGGAFTLLTPTLLTTSTYSDATPVVGSPVYRVVAVDTSGNASTGTDVAVPRSVAARASSTTSGTGSSLSVAKPAGTQAGDVIVVGIDNLGSGTPSAPSGWAQVTSRSATGLRQTAFVRVVGASDGNSYAFGLGSSQGATAIAVAYVGVDPTTPFDAGADQANASSAQIVAPTVAAADKAVLVTISGIVTTTSIAPANGMSEAAEISLGSGKSKLTTEAADQIFGSAGSTGTRTATATKSAINIGTAIALRPSGSAPPPPPDPTAPGVPLNVAASAGSAKVTLTWAHPASDGGSAITNYRIYRSTATGQETELARIGNVTTFVDTNLTNGTRYFYKVAAENAVGVGAQSGEVSATPVAATAPPTPLNVKAVPAKPRGIALSWSASAGATGYQIYRGTASGGETFLVSVGATTSYKDTTAASGVTYYYTIVATNAVGARPPSLEVSAIAR
jgi:titin